MTLTWGDLTETPPLALPARAIVKSSRIDVVGYDRHVLAPPDGSGVCLARDTLTERFSGGLDGEGHAEHLRVIQPDGSNIFVGFERFTGSLAGRRGSFALTCQGTTTADGLVHGVWRIIAGSATDGLTGLRGRGEFTAHLHTDGMWRSEDVLTYWYEPEGSRALVFIPGGAMDASQTASDRRTKSDSE